MKGKQLLDAYISKRDDYARTLLFMYTNIRESLYPILERAEKEGKKLDVKTQDGSIITDEITIDDIILV